jgi:hypothetical protein
MKLLSLLTAAMIMALLASQVVPALAKAKRRITNIAGNVWLQHNERLDYLASGAIEDPKAHWTTDREVNDSLAYFCNLNFTRLEGMQ